MLDYHEEIIQCDSSWDIIEDWVQCHALTFITFFSALSCMGIWVIAYLLKWGM